MMTKRIACFLAVLALTPLPVGAQQKYPTKPIRLMTPFAPGGGSDILARLIGPQLTEVFGQPIVVDNRPGGAGTIATTATVRAAPDGYTLILVSGSYGVNAALYPKLAYDPVSDIAPIILIGTTPLLLAVHPSVPIKATKEFIDYTREYPGKLTFGTAGLGDLGHLAGELFKLETKTQFTHVPYKGSGPTMIAIVSGEVQVSISSLVPAVPHLKAGRMRAIAVTTPKRARVLPDVPTVAETVPGFEVTHWYGIWGPKALPKDIVARWNQEVGRIIRTDAVQKFLEREGMEPAGGAPDEFHSRIKADVEKWKGVVKRAKISVSS